MMSVHAINYGRAEGSALERVVSRLALIGAWTYPLLPHASLYATWFVAWFTLGHLPRGVMDDPKGIGGFVDPLFVVTAVLVITAPVAGIGAFILGALATTWWVKARGGTRVAVMLAIVALTAWYSVSLLFFRADPFHVFYWFLD
jgi:hypothetical protein